MPMWSMLHNLEQFFGIEMSLFRRIVQIGSFSRIITYKSKAFKVFIISFINCLTYARCVFGW